MKKGKKLIALAMTCVMTLSLLSGCGSSGSKSKGEPITLTVFSQLANFNGPIQGWGADLLLEKFNVILNIVPDQNGAMQNRLAAGDLGDIVVFGSDGGAYLQAINAGLLYDWNEDDLLADYGEYIQEHFPLALEKNASIVPEGVEPGVVHGFGHNLCTAGASGIDSVLYQWDVRWDLYNELGCPRINELEDFIGLFEQMHEICPTDENGNPTYAFSMWPDWDGNMVMYVKAMATAYYGYDEFGFGLYDPETGDFYDCLDESGPYMRVLRFLNQLNQRGLIDPNSSTTVYTTVTEKMLAGGVFCSIFNYAGSDIYNTEEHIAENKMFLPLTPKAARPIVYGLSPYGGNRVWTIGAKTQYPELCMEIINWLATPEGAMTLWYGPKGVTWDYDEEGNTYFTELGKKTNADPNGTSMESAGYSGTYQDGIIQINNTTWSESAINEDSNGEVFDCSRWASEQLDPLCETEAAWRAFNGVNSSFEYVLNTDYMFSPGSTYSEGERSDELDTTWEHVATVIVNGSWNAIKATSDEEFSKVVQDMRTECYKLGYEECIEWCLKEAELRKAAEDAVR